MEQLGIDGRASSLDQLLRRLGRGPLRRHHCGLAVCRVRVVVRVGSDATHRGDAVAAKVRDRATQVLHTWATRGGEHHRRGVAAAGVEEPGGDGDAPAVLLHVVHQRQSMLGEDRADVLKHSGEVGVVILVVPLVRPHLGGAGLGGVGHLAERGDERSREGRGAGRQDALQLAGLGGHHAPPIRRAASRAGAIASE